MASFIVEPEPSFASDAIDQRWHSFIASLTDSRGDNHAPPAARSSDSTDNRASVTICIPVRNRAEMLYQAVASLAHQAGVHDIMNSS